MKFYFENNLRVSEWCKEFLTGGRRGWNAEHQVLPAPPQQNGQRNFLLSRKWDQKALPYPTHPTPSRQWRTTETLPESKKTLARTEFASWTRRQTQKLLKQVSYRVQRRPPALPVEEKMLVRPNATTETSQRGRRCVLREEINIPESYITRVRPVPPRLWRGEEKPALDNEDTAKESLEEKGSETRKSSL